MEPETCEQELKLGVTPPLEEIDGTADGQCTLGPANLISGKHVGSKGGSTKMPDLPESSAACRETASDLVVPDGIERIDATTFDSFRLRNPDSGSGHSDVPLDAELAEIVSAWDELPGATRAALLVMVRDERTSANS